MEHQTYIDDELNPRITACETLATSLQAIHAFFNQFDTSTMTMAELQTAVDSCSITDFRSNWIDDYVASEDTDERARTFVQNNLTYLNENISNNSTTKANLESKKTEYEAKIAGTWTAPVE